MAYKKVILKHASTYQAQLIYGTPINYSPNVYYGLNHNKMMYSHRIKMYKADIKKTCTSWSIQRRTVSSHYILSWSKILLRVGFVEVGFRLSLFTLSSVILHVSTTLVQTSSHHVENHQMTTYVAYKATVNTVNKTDDVIRPSFNTT